MTTTPTPLPLPPPALPPPAYAPGLHVLATFGAPAAALRDAAGSRQFFAGLVARLGLTSVCEVYHEFAENGGFTAVLALTESHLSIHTWPEHGLATFDVFPSNFRHSAAFPLLAWVGVVLLIDVAHVYGTLFQTYFDPAQRRQRRTLLLVPLACYAGGVALHAAGGLVFWRALAYLAVFHLLSWKKACGMASCGASTAPYSAGFGTCPPWLRRAG